MIPFLTQRFTQIRAQKTLSAEVAVHKKTDIGGGDDHGRAEGKKGDVSGVGEKDAELEEREEFDDYLELVIQFGYV